MARLAWWAAEFAQNAESGSTVHGVLPGAELRRTACSESAVRWRTGEIYGVEASGQMIGLWPACVSGGQPVPGGGVLSHPLYVSADGAGAVAAKPVQMARSHGWLSASPACLSSACCARPPTG